MGMGSESSGGGTMGDEKMNAPSSGGGSVGEDKMNSRSGDAMNDPKMGDSGSTSSGGR
jgi:hypothetical protein